jgi:hypothetical protein
MEKLTSIERRIRDLETQFSKTSTPDETLALEFELAPLEDELAKHSCIVIVFSAVTVEAYIYDYAARRLSDKFVQTYLDKLDTVSKWMIVPQLITGKPLPKDGNWLVLLRSLMKERNSIIHSKTKDISSGFDNNAPLLVKNFIERTRRIPSKARQSIELLDILAAEISKLDPEEATFSQIYLT